MHTVKRFIISRIVTPERARSVIAHVLSWTIYRCVIRGTWDVISALPKWLRRLADFIEQWNATELSEEKDRLIADLVAGAVTDEAVDGIIDRVVELKEGKPKEIVE